MDGDSSVSHYNHISPLAETLRITHQVTTTFQKCITMVPMVLGTGTKSGRLVKVPQILLQKQRQRQLKCSISSRFVLYYSQIFGLHIEILREILLQNVCLSRKRYFDCINWFSQIGHVDVMRQRRFICRSSRLGHSDLCAFYILLYPYTHLTNAFTIDAQTLFYVLDWM